LIVLDTHVLLWAIPDCKKLSRAAEAAIRKSRREDGITISAVTLRKIASLVTHGRIQGYRTVEGSVNRLLEGVTIKPITLKLPPWPRSLPMTTHTIQPTA